LAVARISTKVIDGHGSQKCGSGGDHHPAATTQNAEDKLRPPRISLALINRRDKTGMAAFPGAITSPRSAQH
jgi:hypothetical protein